MESEMRELEQRCKVLVDKAIRSVTYIESVAADAVWSAVWKASYLAIQEVVREVLAEEGLGKVVGKK